MTPSPMPKAAELLARIDEDDPYAVPFADLITDQLVAIDEQLRERRGLIKLLDNRADESSVSGVRSLADVVPLLFSHTAYKSYPEKWLTEARWDRLGKWLDTISSARVASFDTSDIEGLDDWLARLEIEGHLVSCSSGTTVKCSMLNATATELDFVSRAFLQTVCRAGIKPGNDRRIIGLGQVASTPRNRIAGSLMMEAFSAPDKAPFAPDVPAITIGSILVMVVLRKKIAEGNATPSEVAHYEAGSAKRARDARSAVEQMADALIEHRHDLLQIGAMFPGLYEVAKLVRARGFGAKDFHPNCTFLTGGLKRAQLPEDYREFIFETFNIRPELTGYAYGMQEINTLAPLCGAGRYHMPPWIVFVLLDEAGENFIEPPAGGEVEGRAAFHDLSIEGRWGGIISGDKVRATWETCGCGSPSPSVGADIQRYDDTASGDKITCSGTIDAYVRGAV